MGTQTETLPWLHLHEAGALALLWAIQPGAGGDNPLSSGCGNGYPFPIARQFPEELLVGCWWQWDWEGDTRAHLCTVSPQSYPFLEPTCS